MSREKTARSNQNTIPSCLVENMFSKASRTSNSSITAPNLDPRCQQNENGNSR